jgi:dolichol-phosphate mannosyltransferase
MIYIVLPAYNEENSLGALLGRIRASLETFPGGYEVIVVNDGSVDQTLTIAQQQGLVMPIQIVDHGHNKGLGEALKSGLRTASEKAQSQDAIITMDADNTHSPDLIPAMVAKIGEGYDLVVASRYVPGAEEIGLSFHRSLLSKCAATLLKICFPFPGVRDYTCGYRAYRAAILKKAMQVYGDALVQERGFTSIVEILLKLRRLGAVATELPLILRYDLKGGASKMPVMKTILRYWTIIRQNIFLPGTRPFRNVNGAAELPPPPRPHQS